ncbi:NADH-quinone oxidoreductase subunit NuoE [Candidatus Latescibacterota bacterium]
MDECLKEILLSFEEKSEELIPVLQEVQKEFGYLSEEAMLEIAKFLGVPESRVYAVATFYTQFRFTPIGRNHVVVCRGTACHVRGATRVLEKIENQLGIQEGETTPDMEYSLETVACIGACGLAPNMVINDKTYGRLTMKKVTEILADVQSKENGGQNEK